ncbi:MAG TPA: hypothetical protein VEL51_22540 [Vicinamibacterales bacterium]|nr:hypothetical protein [Vicinamibacterales bacterium]
MPSEFEESEPGLQRDLQPPPLCPAGAPNAPALGAAEPEAAEAPAGAPEANVGQPGAPLPAPAPSRTPWLSPDDGPLLQTDTKPVRVCPKCNIPLPVDATNCWSCGQYVPGHKDARKRLKKHDVDALISKAKADYAPATTLAHHLCENLGLSLAELKATRPGSPDHQRLLAAVQTIVAILDVPRSSAPAPADLDGLTDDQLIARMTTHLRFLINARELEQAPCRPTDVDGGLLRDDVSDAGPSVKASADPAGEASLPTSAPAPEPPCMYCHQPLARCAEIRETRLDTWEVLHRNDPIVVKKRDDDATKEMFESLRRQRTGDPWIR